MNRTIKRYTLAVFLLGVASLTYSQSIISGLPDFMRSMASISEVGCFEGRFEDGGIVVTSSVIPFSDTEYFELSERNSMEWLADLDEYSLEELSRQDYRLHRGSTIVNIDGSAVQFMDWNGLQISRQLDFAPQTGGDPPEGYGVFQLFEESGRKITHSETKTIFNEGCAPGERFWKEEEEGRLAYGDETGEAPWMKEECYYQKEERFLTLFVKGEVTSMRVTRNCYVGPH